MTIRSLFDPSKDIYRTIEKVITYGASQEGRLKAEISEYVVTESIEEQFRKLLDSMQLAMQTGGQNEVGVWVSGFYGSGKSSFTKYLGLAFDDQRTIDGTPFIKYLQDRLHKPQTKALLSTVAQRYPAAVVMLDLASRLPITIYMAVLLESRTVFSGAEQAGTKIYVDFMLCVHVRIFARLSFFNNIEPVLGGCLERA